VANFTGLYFFKTVKMNGYDLTRAWYNFKFDNPDRVRHIHSDFYFYLVDKWNRLGQTEKFGLPTEITMQALGIGSYNTYKKALYDLVDFGFVKIVCESKNQHQSKIVALSKIDKALDKALDKATIKASDEAPDKATDTIIEQETTKQQTNEQQTIDVPTKVVTPPKKKILFTECSMLDFEPEKQKAFEIAKGFWQLFGANLKEIGAPLANINKADANEWTRQIALMLKNKEATVDQLREVWDFLKVDEFWKPNVQSVPKLREKFTTIYSQSKKPKNGTNSTGGLSEEGKLRILEKLASGDRFQEEQRQKHASQMPNE
jgi:hypothetical protein